MKQLLAVLTDSLRHLRQTFLFWITLLLSALAAFVLFGTYSFNPNGVQVLWFPPIENPAIAEGSSGPRMMVTGLLSGIYVKIWLGWGAIILALLSTASILPSFLTSGTIDLSLAKPISRAKLFLFKVIGANLFVLLQVSISVFIVFVLIGLKFSIWIPTVLLAIPLITLQFFYIYSVSALVAVVTRSTLAALLISILVWFLAFLVQFAANQSGAAATSFDSMAERSRTRVQNMEQYQERLEDGPAQYQIQALENERRKLELSEAQARMLDNWAGRLETIELFVPKTGDVQKLLSTRLNAPLGNEFASLFLDIESNDAIRPAGIDEEEWRDQLAADTAGEARARRVDAAVSLGTSLAFCAVCLGFATFVFVRKDF